jgi:pimeloyl-ACP methyl ester carboxylesterase
MSHHLRSLERSTLPFALLLAVAWGPLPAQEATSESGTHGRHSSLRGPLLLFDEGTFFVNDTLITSDYPTAPDTVAPTPGSFVINQMFVHYRIPLQQRHKTPLVLVHGGGLTGVTYESTPDGREGWATFFTRHGFPVYVVDFPGRGRAGFNPTAINQGKQEDDISVVPEIRRTTAEGAWTAFRFGPAYGEEFPHQKFPLEALQQFSAQGVPSSDVTLEGGSLQQAPVALAKLLDKIGPAIVLVHSQSGPFADILVALRPGLVRGVINVEGSQGRIPTDEEIAAYEDVPDLEVFGDFVIDNPVSTGQPRYDGRKAVVDRINAAGGDAAIVMLPEIGLNGNTHMLMQDKNNLRVANWLLDWIHEKVERRHQSW